MCTTCGCGDTVNPAAPGGAVGQGEHEHVGADGVVYRHAHQHQDAAHVHEREETRRVRVERDLLDRNDAFAADNRAFFTRHGVLALNLVSSPGSGKTSLLVRTIEMLRGAVPLGVIEGDQQTSLDSDRIRAAGAASVQINTGKGCHLDAQRVQEALPVLGLPQGGLLFIENVGNLVCPAAFDLGEAGKVVILSLTEGEDKPLKYPDMFRAARLMLITKTDLLPHLEVDVRRIIDNARRVNPRIEIIELSAQSGDGMERWIAWLERERVVAQAERAASEKNAAQRGLSDDMGEGDREAQSVIDP